MIRPSEGDVNTILNQNRRRRASSPAPPR